MEYKKALHKAAVLCSQQERCVSDIRKKLVNWELSDDECDKAIDHLISEKYLDDGRYSQFFVRDKFRFNGWGRTKIKYQLKQKSISSFMIEDALEEIDEQEYLEKLAELLQVKMHQLRNKDPWKAKASMVRFAQSRGYEPHLIFTCIERLFTSSD